MITIDEIEKNITDRTAAIIAVDLFGGVLPLDDIEELANRHALVLIEDAAQSFGALYHGRRAGSMGNASCLSFDPVKNLSSFGSGGMYLTNDWSSAVKVQAYRNHGRMYSANHDLLGVKSKMTTVDAATVLLKLNHYRSENRRRENIAWEYIHGLADFDEIGLPTYPNGVDPIWHKFVIVVKSKEGLRDYLAKYGIQTKNVYPQPLYDEPIFYEYKKGVCVNAEVITKGNIALPIFPDMTDEEVEYVIEMVKKFYQ